MKPAVFVDRDGVLIDNVDAYVRRWEDVFVFDQAITALLRLNAVGLPIVVVTNQSAIGRGVVPREVIEEINTRVLGIFEAKGVRFAGAYLCPHAPEAGCDCRKPQPGMLLAAASDLGLDLAQSYMVGDAITDIQAGEAAGVKTILVRTGRGAKEAERLESRTRCPVVKDLTEAVGIILKGKH